MKCCYILIILFLFSSVHGTGPVTGAKKARETVQVPVGRTADHDFETAQNWLKAINYDSAAVYFIKAEEHFRETGDCKRIIDCCYLTAFCFWNTADYRAAKTIAQSALARPCIDDILDRKIDILNLLGLVARKEVFLDLSRAYYKRALNICSAVGPGGKQYAEIYENLADAFQAEGKSDSVLYYLEKSLAIVKEQPKPDQHFVARIYNSMSIACRNLGDFEHSLLYSDKCLAIHAQIPGDPNALAKIHNSRGITLARKQQYRSALVHFKQAETNIHRSINADKHLLSNIYNNIGLIHVNLDDFQNGIDYLNKVLLIKTQMFGPDHPALCKIYNNLGHLFLTLKKWDKAITYFSKAVGVLEKNDLSNKDLGLSFANLGESYREINLHELSLECYQKALRVFMPSFSYNSIFDNPAVADVKIDFTFIEILSDKAKSIEAYYKKTKNIEHLKCALNTYELALEYMDKSRKTFHSKNSGINKGQTAHKYAAAASKICRQLFTLTGHSVYQEKIFSIVEKTKVGVLLDELNETMAKKYSGIPDSLLEKESRLKRHLAELDTKIQKSKHSGDSDIQDLKSRYFNERVKYTQLLTFFEKKYPDYHQLKHNTRPISIREARDRIGPRSAIIEYFCSDSTLYIVFLDQSTLDVVTVPMPEFELVTDLHSSIMNTDFSVFTETSNRLYSSLISPIKSKLAGKDLIIIPDGFLYYIPFEVLLSGKPEPTPHADYSNLDYLIKNHKINYFYSVTWYVHHFEKRFHPATRHVDFVGMAPVVFRDSTLKNLVNLESILTTFHRHDQYLDQKRSAASHHQSLPATEYEVKQIADIFRRYNKTTSVYLYSQASKDRVFSLGMNTYIHLATHGFYNIKNSKLSGILLSPGKNASDDVLRLGEIYGMELSADLVVLSACETAIGKLAPGEGLLGFVRALHYAGAQNVITSMWKIVDTTSANFMIAFYSHLLSGREISTALRTTKLEFLNDPMYSDPYFWAPFVLVGK